MRVFVAADAGACAALAPIAAHAGSTLADVSPDAAATEAHWARQFSALRASMLVAGTSDSARGRIVEAAARRAARAARVPLAAIEDFPGNYTDVVAGEATLVLVESTGAAEILRRRLGARAPALAVAAPARYDAYRARIDELRRGTAATWDAENGHGPCRVLWAGQPDTADCTRTLAELLPALAAAGAELLFKAHPRDPGYVCGAYARQCDDSGVPWLDLTGTRVSDALARAPHVVVTQFSSVAMEAGFFGIPALWVLLADAGGARLLEKKGYETPPLCAAGGGLCVSDRGELGVALASALGDRGRRARLLAEFDRYFVVGHPALPQTLNALQTIDGQNNL